MYYMTGFLLLLPVILICIHTVNQAIDRRSGVTQKRFYFALCVFYLLLVLWITLISRKKETNIGIVTIPLSTYFSTFFGEGSLFDCIGQVINKQKNAWLHLCMAFDGLGFMLLNIELFIPFGYLLKKIGLKRKHISLTAVCVSVLIETMQLCLKLGWFDIDDIINNVCGAIIGSCFPLKIIQLSMDKGDD